MSEEFPSGYTLMHDEDRDVFFYHREAGTYVDAVDDHRVFFYCKESDAYVFGYALSNTEPYDSYEEESEDIDDSTVSDEEDAVSFFGHQRVYLPKREDVKSSVPRVAYSVSDI